MEGQKRTKGAGSCQGKRDDGSGKTGTDLNGRHLLGHDGRHLSGPAADGPKWTAQSVCKLG